MMNLVKPSFEILEIMGMKQYMSPLTLIEKVGRTCYKSESKITADSANKFVQKINKLGHESVIEHSAMVVKFICDRGVSHELVRHRLCAFSRESTRYVNYKGGCTFVIPPWVDVKEGKYSEEDGVGFSNHANYIWYQTMIISECAYIDLLNHDWSPQQARSALPNSTKTEIVVAANFREWRHIFKLRCSKAAHPQMRELMIPLHKECKRLIPIIFDDIEYGN
jgi:thymidylate synthase (FAD)